MHVVVIEDSAFLRSAWQTTLEAEGVQVSSYATPEEFQAAWAALKDVDLVVTDWFFDPLSELSGEAVLQTVQADAGAPPVVIASDAKELVQGQPCAAILGKDQINRAALAPLIKPSASAP